MPGRRGYLGTPGDPNAPTGRGRNGAAPLTPDEKAFVSASRWNDYQDSYYDSDGGGGGYGSYGGGYGSYGHRKRRWWRSHEFRQIRMFTRRAFAAQGAAVGGMFALDSAGVLDGLEKWYAGIFATMAMTVGFAAIAGRKAYKEYAQNRNRARAKAAYKPAPPPVLAQKPGSAPAGSAPATGTAGTPAGSVPPASVPPGPVPARGAPAVAAPAAPVTGQPAPAAPQAPPAVAPVSAPVATPAPELTA